MKTRAEFLTPGDKVRAGDGSVWTVASVGNRLFCAGGVSTVEVKFTHGGKVRVKVSYRFEVENEG